MKTHTLSAQKRTVFGKAVKTLRKNGSVPATLYGRAIPSESIQVTSKDFIRVFDEAGETGLISLTVGNKTHPVLISNVQKHPVTNEVLHVEFHEVNLKEKVKTNVPVELNGESSAIKENLGTLLQLINEIEVEALPTDLPEKIEVDITKLTAVNDAIQIKDLSPISSVTVLADPEQIIVKIGQLTAPEPEPVAEVAPEKTSVEPTEEKAEDETSVGAGKTTVEPAEEDKSASKK